MAADSGTPQPRARAQRDRETHGREASRGEEEPTSQTADRSLARSAPRSSRDLYSFSLRFASLPPASESLAKEGERESVRGQKRGRVGGFNFKNSIITTPNPDPSSVCRQFVQQQQHTEALMMISGSSVAYLRLEQPQRSLESTVR